jgi:hypothetical protein
MIQDPLETDPAAPLITVHRRRHLRLLVIGFGLIAVMAAFIAAIAIFEPLSIPWYLDGLYKLIGGAAGAMIGLGALPYVMRRLFVYDPRTRSVTARERLWGTWEHYPRKNFDRLEYESATGRIVEVQADGKRKRVPVNRGDAVGSEWREFVEQFDRDHAPVEPRSEPGRDVPNGPFPEAGS